VTFRNDAISGVNQGASGSESTREKITAGSDYSPSGLSAETIRGPRARKRRKRKSRAIVTNPHRPTVVIGRQIAMRGADPAPQNENRATGGR